MRSVSTPASLLPELFTLDADGTLRWKVSRGRVAAGDTAGWVDSDGYRMVRLQGRGVFAHHIVWAMHHGGWPTQDIDHKDGDKANNHPDNLRLATHAMNMQNRKTVNRNSTTGKLGVTKNTWSKRNPYTAQITVGGKVQYLGCYPTVESAHRAYLGAKRELHEGNTL